MTFHDMEKRIKNVNNLVSFVYFLRDQYKKENPNDTETLAKYGYIADYLCAYRNVLQYEKEYEEAKRALWIKDKSKRRGDGEIYDYCCSLCQGGAVEGSYGNLDVLTNYCPHCGAEMEKEK